MLAYTIVKEIITGVGAKLIFLPPYSPDLMPLEEVFSKIKSVLKANDTVYTSTTMLVKLTFCSITQADCFSYIKHAGYI